MPHPPVCAARRLLAGAWPWAGLLAVSMTLAWAMNVGLTAGSQVPEAAHAQPLPSPTGFILTITYKDADGPPASFTCRSSRDLVSADVLHVASAQDLYEQVALVCREPPPGAR